MVKRDWTSLIGMLVSGIMYWQPCWMAGTISFLRFQCHPTWLPALLRDTTTFCYLTNDLIQSNSLSYSILASQLRSDWSVSFDRLESTYFVTWGAHLTLPPSGEPAKAEGSVSTIGGPLPSYGRKLGKLEPNDFKQVIAKGIKTYGRFAPFPNPHLSCQ